MGLDMYAVTQKTRPTQAVDFKASKNDEPEELHYWRKHPDLHGWMEALYMRKGGENPEFNMSPLLLDSVDLDQLEKDVRADRLPETQGFFFGASTDEDREDDLEFISKARRAIAEGKSVVYYAWW